jgi:RNA ligase (TIGR02306 family)
LITALGLSGKLAGSGANRIKTVRLRGEISQGIVADPTVIVPGWNDSNGFHEGRDIAELLGVTKYEPPAIPSHVGNLVALPPLVSVYDIEGAERFTNVVETLLMDAPVIITEKLEGSHFAASIFRDGEIAICQRRFKIDPVENAEHDWYKVARLSGLIDKLPALKTEVDRRYGAIAEVVTVRGEVLGPGIQGNYYKLPTLALKIFDIEVNGQPLGVAEYRTLVNQLAIDTVPLLATDLMLRDWLADKTLAQASNGQSALNPALLREGVVIRPLTEMRNEQLGRVIIKQRSPEYLAGSDY